MMSRSTHTICAVTRAVVKQVLAYTGGLLLVVSPSRVCAQPAHEHKQQEQQPAEAQPPPDWPVVIAQLLQDMHERPGHAQTRDQLATAYNNYGVSLSEQQKWDLAIQQLEEAIKLDDTKEAFRNNLSSIYLAQAQDAYKGHQANGALEALDKALALNPDSAQAYGLRGQIEYDRQKLKEAQAAWKRAVDIDPTQAELAKRLAQVTQELPVESKFEKLSQVYFDLRYEEQLEHPIGFDIRDALLDARRSVGADFAYWPKHKLVVLIYSAKNFHQLQQETPEWAGGQFDGKIRVPLPSAQLSQATVRQILFHEYTHAVIFDLTNDKCPRWLNEGLAEYEGRTQLAGSLKRLQSAFDGQQLIPWQELSGHFSPTAPVQEVAAAYEQAYSISVYLVKRCGFWRVRRLLKAIGDGQSWETALADTLHMKLAKIEADWRNWLPELLHASP